MKNIFTIEKLSFAYAGQAVLNIQKLNIAANKVTALVGPNGTGKSTLFDILAGLRSADTAKLEFNGEPVKQKNMALMRRQIGYVQQKPYLLKMTVRENISLGLTFRGHSLADIHAAVDKIAAELQLKYLLDRHAPGLSGGELQKIALARALVLQPKIMIMDEPFTYLDEHTEREMEQWIRQQKDSGDKTILFSTHDRLKAHSMSDYVLSLLNADVYTESFSNMFVGEVDAANKVFTSGKMRFELPEHIHSGHTLFIDPKHLVVSKEKLPSSMRNHFQGVLSAMNSINNEVHLKIDGDAVFNVVITPKSLSEMALQPGEGVWVSCKSSQIRVI